MKDCNNSQKNCQQTGVIYKITNLLNGKCYVGQTIDLKERLRKHKKNKKSVLGQAIQKYGWENFSYEVLESDIPRDMLDEREIFYIAENNCVAPNGYNLTKGGNSRKVLSDEARKKISIATRAAMTPEVCAFLSAINKGKTLSEEHKAKIGKAGIGRKHTEESKQKMSEAQKGEKNSFYGKSHTKETLSKMSESHKNPSPETRAKFSESKKGEKNHFYGKHHTEESKQKMSATRKAYWAEKKKNSEGGCEE